MEAARRGGAGGDGRARLVRVSLDNEAGDFSAAEIEDGSSGTRFTLLESGRPAGRFSSPLVGTHNLRNTLGAVALVRGLGLSTAEIERALPRFSGVRRRLEVKGERNGILVVDDFAHHPTAVRGTLQAARSRWPGRRVWALFEPRSNTAGRKMFEEEYADAFSAADALIVAPVFHARRLEPVGVLDRAALVRRFTDAGRPGFAPESLEDIPALLRAEARSGDVLLLMSSGAFGKLPATLLDSL
jgi:UDP-N-acetylmuramate: L-alanyl-gamma-D-glutamyl-meso-diaminopimelate ligase